LVLYLFVEFNHIFSGLQGFVPEGFRCQDVDLVAVAEYPPGYFTEAVNAKVHSGGAVGNVVKICMTLLILLDFITWLLLRILYPLSRLTIPDYMADMVVVSKFCLGISGDDWGPVGFGNVVEAGSILYDGVEARKAFLR
jgi:hypothetical protein